MFFARTVMKNMRDSACHGAKRAAAFAAFLKDELLEDVAHAQWVFTLPKMLRRYFLYNRRLLGELCRAAYDTVAEMMAAAVEEDEIDQAEPCFDTRCFTFSKNKDSSATSALNYSCLGNIQASQQTTRSRSIPAMNWVSNGWLGI